MLLKSGLAKFYGERSNLESQLKEIKHREQKLQDKLIESDSADTNFMGWLRKSVQKLEAE